VGGGGGSSAAKFSEVLNVGNYGVSEVERRSETRSLNVCALCLGARPTGV
jgi:hypothetical protein